MHRGKTTWWWMGVISGVFILTATAEKLPSDGEYEAREANTIPRNVGKIIKVKFNRIYQTTRLNNGMYTGELRSTEPPVGPYSDYRDRPGLKIQFPVKGLDFFLKSFSVPEMNGYLQLLTAPNRDVYIQISNTTDLVFAAIGDVCKENGEEAEYSWSVETKIPDLTQKRKIFIRNILLFPDQLKGKTLEVEFYRVGEKVEEIADGGCIVTISGGGGHCLTTSGTGNIEGRTEAVTMRVPSEGTAFFKKLARGGFYNKRYSIYAEVVVSESGNITLEAKGFRASGSGDDAKYRW